MSVQHSQHLIQVYFLPLGTVEVYHSDLLPTPTQRLCQNYRKSRGRFSGEILEIGTRGAVGL